MKEKAHVLYDIWVNEMAGKQPAQPMWNQLAEYEKDSWRAIVRKLRTAFTGS